MGGQFWGNWGQLLAVCGFPRNLVQSFRSTGNPSRFCNLVAIQFDCDDCGQNCHPDTIGELRRDCTAIVELNRDCDVGCLDVAQIRTSNVDYPGFWCNLCDALRFCNLIAIQFDCGNCVQHWNGFRADFAPDLGGLQSDCNSGAILRRSVRIVSGLH